MSQIGVGNGHVAIEIAKARADAQLAPPSLPYDGATRAKPVLFPAWAARVGSGDGLVPVLPMDDELFLDIDDEADLQVVKANLAVLESNGFAIVETKRTESKSGNGHQHVYLKAPRDLNSLERIAFQACLGSDRKREALSLLRHMDGKYAPTVFFEVPKPARNGEARRRS